MLSSGIGKWIYSLFIFKAKWILQQQFDAMTRKPLYREHCLFFPFNCTYVVLYIGENYHTGTKWMQIKTTAIHYENVGSFFICIASGHSKMKQLITHDLDIIIIRAHWVLFTLPHSLFYHAPTHAHLWIVAIMLRWNQCQVNQTQSFTIY